MNRLKNGNVEECGIPAEAVEELERLFEKRRVRIHGYLLLSGRTIVAEKYYAPYTRESNHRMYSVTKSFVALAVGLLVKKGMVSLEDRICDYFPEKLPEGGAHPWCAEMTIRDMLTMRTCHGSTTYKRYDGGDWTESFFRVMPDHVPGTVFSYDTSSSHVLAALVEKLTGKKMLDFMREEMLSQLDFSEGAYILPDPAGVSQGGSGMMSTLRDVAGVAWLCSHFGMDGDRELLPADYMREALSCQVPTDLQPVLDEQCGYGYFIWMPREEGFTFFGMGGQLAVCFPQYDFCYLTMADTIGNPAGVQILHDCFYEAIYPYLQKRTKIKGESHLTGKEQSTSLPAQNRRGRNYEFYPNKMGWESLCFDWEQGTLTFVIPEGRFCLAFGDDEWRRQTFLDTGYQCQCRGYWKLGHFFLECFLTDEEQGNVRMDFAWKDSRLSLRAVSTPDPFREGMQKHFQGFASAREVS